MKVDYINKGRNAGDLVANDYQYSQSTVGPYEILFVCMRLEESKCHAKAYVRIDCPEIAKLVGLHNHAPRPIKQELIGGLLKYDKIRTEHGRERIIVDGHLFRKRLGKEYNIIWDCTQVKIRKCKVQATTYNDRCAGKAYIKGIHNHGTDVHDFYGKGRRAANTSKSSKPKPFQEQIDDDDYSEQMPHELLKVLIGNTSPSSENHSFQDQSFASNLSSIVEIKKESLD